MTQYLQDSIFWIEVEKIEPNPYQPRKEFDENALRDLADSIRQYGVLQPLVVTRKEEPEEDGEGIRVSYELIAGERRLRASKLAEVAQVPAVIRAEREDPREKLELAIIENLQREDLNPIDRARAFARLVEEFGFKHAQVAKKVGRSREYISNTLRLLDLPEEIMQALRERKISEGHARTMMMLSDRPDEQKVLFKEIVYKKLSVREAEGIAREIAHDKVRKKKNKPDPEITALEGKLSNTLGARVHIQRKENGGKLVIDFFSHNDLEDILSIMESNKQRGSSAFMDRFIAAQEELQQKQNDSSQGENTSNENNVPTDPNTENQEQAEAKEEQPSEEIDTLPQSDTNEREVLENNDNNPQPEAPRSDAEAEPISLPSYTQQDTPPADLPVQQDEFSHVKSFETESSPEKETFSDQIFGDNSEGEEAEKQRASGEGEHHSTHDRSYEENFHNKDDNDDNDGNDDLYSVKNFTI